MQPVASQFSGVTAHTKANVYFDGGVVSHTLVMPDGGRKTLGLIRPGSYHFETGAAELMEIVDGSAAAAEHGAGARFEVPAKSGFQIEVAKGLCQYICSFLG
jgi:uncharacterized protein YaiE (UPF0345 family)